MVQFVLAFLVSFATLAHAAEFTNLEAKTVPIETCSTPAPAHATTLLQKEKNIIIAAWNVENVMDNRKGFVMTGLNPDTLAYHYEFVAGLAQPLADWKFEAKQQKIASIGEYLNENGSPLAHFIISPEVEDLYAADNLFNTGVLKGKYRTLLIEGNDERGIDVAFAIRADLDVTLEAETHKDVFWNDPTERQNIRLFSRDLPVVIVKDRASKKVLLVLIGNHAKSKRDRNGDRESTKLRTAQYEAANLIIKGYMDRFGAKTPIFFAGDFNTDVRTGSEVTTIRALLKDVFDIVGLKDRTTETYFPMNGPMVASQLDAIFTTPATSRYILQAEVLPEFDRHTGERLGLPKSFKDRSDNYPSDHRAIAVVLSGKAVNQ